MNDVFAAVNSSDPISDQPMNTKEIRSLSTAEYYIRSGLKKNQYKFSKLKETNDIISSKWKQICRHTKHNTLHQDSFYVYSKRLADSNFTLRSQNVNHYRSIEFSCIFGEKLLTEAYLQQFDLWVDGCPSLGLVLPWSFFEMTVFRTKNNKIESEFYKAGANSDGADFYKFSLLKTAYSLFETDQVIRGKTNPEVVYKETINTTNIKSSISFQAIASLCT